MGVVRKTIRAAEACGRRIHKATIRIQDDGAITGIHVEYVRQGITVRVTVVGQHTRSRTTDWRVLRPTITLCRRDGRLVAGAANLSDGHRLSRRHTQLIYPRAPREHHPDIH